MHSDTIQYYNNILYAPIDNYIDLLIVYNCLHQL